MASLGSCYPLRRWKGRSRGTSSPWYSREQGLLTQVLSVISYWILSKLGISEWLSSQGHELIGAYEQLLHLLSVQYLIGLHL